MKAKKENKSYRIKDELEKNRYLKEGYDIYDDDGKLLEHSPLKKIAYSAYAELKEENKTLKAENETLMERVKTLEAEAEVITKKAASKKNGE